MLNLECKKLGKETTVGAITHECTFVRNKRLPLSWSSMQEFTWRGKDDSKKVSPWFSVSFPVSPQNSPSPANQQEASGIRFRKGGIVLVAVLVWGRSGTQTGKHLPDLYHQSFILVLVAVLMCTRTQAGPLISTRSQPGPDLRPSAGSPDRCPSACSADFSTSASSSAALLVSVSNDACRFHAADDVRLFLYASDDVFCCFHASDVTSSFLARCATAPFVSASTTAKMVAVPWSPASPASATFYSPPPPDSSPVDSGTPGLATHHQFAPPPSLDFCSCFWGGGFDLQDIWNLSIEGGYCCVTFGLHLPPLRFHPEGPLTAHPDTPPRSSSGPRPLSAAAGRSPHL
ncbi:uncharacterized protein LOC133550631 [Nerophis ophidion]|uniref:uncharacterized protein LOC133550631 n=1 Tax=Nerophis ophidion TaxID=159077 RepID=UPI002AE087EB|nr:uncharacterized protein LOC133550631 [Nerophis ophidion]